MTIFAKFSIWAILFLIMTAPAFLALPAEGIGGLNWPPPMIKRQPAYEPIIYP